MPNVSHENHLIFIRMTVQVTYIFIPIVSLKDSFCHSGKSRLGIGLFIHELLREPLISYCIVCPLIHYSLFTVHARCSSQVDLLSLDSSHRRIGTDM